MMDDQDALLDNSRTSSQDDVDSGVLSDPSDPAEIMGSINESHYLESSMPGSIHSTSSHQSVFKVYKRRWYLLLLFSLLSFMQGGLANVWAVIAQSVEPAFHWSDTEISLMQLWIYGMFLISILPFMWLLHTKGLRVCMIINGLVMVFGTGLRCITTQTPYVTWLAHAAHACIGLGGPVVFIAGPVLSALWFPTHQRATATAIATIMGFAGAAGVFIMGPLAVEPPHNVSSDTHGHIHIYNNYTNLDAIREEILHLRYAEFAACALIFVGIIIYFPSRPKTPPSLSSSIQKLDIKQGLKEIFSKQNINFWLIGIPYGMSTSVYGVWSSLFDVNLKSEGVTEMTAGWLGFWAVSIGCVAAVVFGRLADIIGRMKLILMCLISGSCVSTFWFVLLAGDYIPWSEPSVYAACIIQGICVNGAIPLYYELAIESSYPVSETVTSGMLTIIYQIFPPFFLLLFLLPGLAHTESHSWMNWVMYGILLASVPLVLSFKERYRRLEVDKMETHVDDLCVQVNAADVESD